MSKTKGGNKNNNGISLIVLVITIIVIIILAAAVILTLTGNNPIDNAKQATFLNDLSSFQDELNMYKTNEFAKSQGDFNQTTLNADISNPVLLYEILPSLEGKTKYLNEIKIQGGILKYLSTDLTKKTWAESINIATDDNVPKLPTITFGTNGGNNLTQVSTIVTVADTSGTGLNLSSLQYVWDTQNITEPISGWAVFTNGEPLTKSGDGTYYLWVKGTDNEGNNVVEKSSLFIVGDLAIPVGTVQTENKTFSGATSGFAYNNPVIPAGFKATNTLEANWNNLNTDYDKGLVIQDANGNEFVWVPVNGITIKYEKNFSYPSKYSASTANTTDDTLPTGISNEIYQSNTYGGFYIGRYEAMFDYNGGNIRAASKKSLNKTNTNWSATRNTTYNGYLWNYITYADSKTYSENMATKYSYDLTKVRTGLVTGTQWDVTMKWIETIKSVTDTRAWGNYSDAIAPANIAGYGSIQISGYNNIWRAKNIYDLAGNMWEWTNERNSGNSIIRSGEFTYSGSNYCASYRYSFVNPASANVFGFRTVLYVM